MKVIMTVSLTQRTKELLEEIAEREGMPMSKVLRKLIIEKAKEMGLESEDYETV